MEPIDPSDPFSNPTFYKWFFGQSVAFITLAISLGMWIRSLVRDKKFYRSALAKSQEKNDELSLYLAQFIERDLKERVALVTDFSLREDSSTRNLLDFFRWQSGKPSTTEHSIARISPGKKREKLPSKPPDDEPPTPER